MRAARIAAWDALPVVADIGEPTPTTGHTVVRIAAAPVAHLDRNVATGRFVHRPPLPYTPGTDGAGTVVDSTVADVGASVWVRGGGLGLTRDGTWAELALVPDEAIHLAPDGVDLAVAASFFSPCASAHAALHDVGDLQPGERVAITGAGGAVGSVAVQLAARAGAGETIGIVSNAARAADVPPGATVVVGDADHEPIDLLIDTVGGPALATRIARVAPGGRVVLVGYAAGTDLGLDLSQLVQRDVRLLPLNMIRRQADAAAVASGLLEDLVAGTLTLRVSRVPLEDVATAWESVRGGTARGRVVVEP